MIAAIRAELRKLFSVRSTYVIIAFCLAITVFFAFYIEGLRTTHNVTDPGKLASEVVSAAQALGLFIALAGVLLMTHEYRYNTILYTLTAARNRTTVLLAKIIAVTLFAVILTLLCCALAPLLTYAGIHAKGLSLAPQTLYYSDLLWRCAFYGWSYSMLALLIAVIVRNQVGTIAILFLVPGLVETLLGLLLKDNAKYLPFHALSSLLAAPGASAPGTQTLTPSQSALVLLEYLIVGWLVAWLLFRRRDPN